MCAWLGSKLLCCEVGDDKNIVALLYLYVIILIINYTYLILHIKIVTTYKRNKKLGLEMQIELHFDSPLDTNLEPLEKFS